MFLPSVFFLQTISYKHTCSPSNLLPFIIHCSVFIYVFICRHISKYILFSQYNVTHMHVSRANSLAPSNQLACFSFRRTPPPVLFICVYFFVQAYSLIRKLKEIY